MLKPSVKAAEVSRKSAKLPWPDGTNETATSTKAIEQKAMELNTLVLVVSVIQWAGIRSLMMPAISFMQAWPKGGNAAKNP